MMTYKLTFLLALAATAVASPLEKRALCTSYTIINTRGTGEPQGESSGFRTINANVRARVSGGKTYNTVYPAGFDQQSSAATTDIINKITSTLRTNPNECFILEGYSQGAAATVNALPRLTGTSFTAVRGVFLIGDPNHHPGLACNVDQNGGTTTRNAVGISDSYSVDVPSNWISKTRDVCISGDGICDARNGIGITAQHLQYPNDRPTQTLGTNFVIQQLQ